jgi:hypothetical protein
MGEASRRKARFLNEHPVCCYCGGDYPAESIDHAPPKGFFRGKYRVSGLEVPSCNYCNSRHADIDDFFAFLGHMQDSASDNRVEARLPSMISSAMKRFPDAVLQLASSAERVWAPQGRLIQPRTQVRFDHNDIRFTVAYSSARLAAAICYNASRQILRSGTRIWVRWNSNGNPFPPDILSRMAQKLPGYVTLQQGIINQSDQFEAAYFLERSFTAGIALLNFHKTFQSVVSFAHPDDSVLEDTDDHLFVITADGIEPQNIAFPVSVRPRIRSNPP